MTSCGYRHGHYKEAIRSEKDPTVMKRLIVVNFVNEGSTTECAARSACVTQRTVQLWLERFRNHGIEGLRDLEGRGRPSDAPISAVRKIADISWNAYSQKAAQLGAQKTWEEILITDLRVCKNYHAQLGAQKTWQEIQQ